MHFSFIEFLYLVFSLLLVSGLVVFVARMYSAFQKGNPRSSGRLASVETLQLDRNRQLKIIACDGRELLLLFGSSEDTFLGWLDHKEGIGSGRSLRA